MVAKKTGPAARLLPVAFTGARGAYSQQALERYFGLHQAGLTCASQADAVRAVQDGRASHAVLAVENSITGPFAGIAEALFEGELVIAGEIVLPIRHCLMALPGTRLDDLTVVTSHPSALAQCRDWLASWSLATRPASDTAQAASDLAASGDRALGVLGSRELAALCGLEVLVEGLSDRADNRTRFFVFRARNGVAPRGARAAILVGPLAQPRALKTLRIRLESLDARRVRAPFLGSADGTRHLVEYDPCRASGEELAHAACGTVPFRFLGAWNPPARPFGAAGNGAGRSEL
jgi:prephenate dehydratase